MAEIVDWESLAEATSGAVGALVSTTVLYPLDTCKTRYQAEVQSHGQRKYRFKYNNSPAPPLSSSSYFLFCMSVRGSASSI